jgi:eukaryotic-like serine/threonine-protein kinase
LAGVVARPGSGVADGVAQAEAIAAMSTLKRAVEGGYRNFQHMRGDPDLDPLRPRPDFQLLMMDLAMPAIPFAR